MPPLHGVAPRFSSFPVEQCKKRKHTRKISSFCASQAISPNLKGTLKFGPAYAGVLKKCWPVSKADLEG